jgi:hypothetical protein
LPNPFHPKEREREKRDGEMMLYFVKPTVQATTHALGRIKKRL